ncbi:unnamed protein product [Sphacelaria rigidula]
MDLVSKASYILNTRLKYVVDVVVLEDTIFVDMMSSTSSRINRSIRDFMSGVPSDGVAVFALRKDTSTNLLLLGVLEMEDVTCVPGSFEVESRDGKFYRHLKQFRVRVKKKSEFNTEHVTCKSHFYDMVKNCSGLGVVCPKMSFGRMPFVRGLISLLGDAGCKVAENGNFSVRHSGCFVKIK